MQKAAFGLCAGILMGCAQAAGAQEAGIEPAGDWETSSDEESCTLVRSFSVQSAGDTQIYLKSWGPNAPNRVSIVGPTMLRHKGKAVPAVAGFGDSENAEIYAIASAYGDQPMMQFQANGPRRRADLAVHGLGYVYTRDFREVAVGLDPSSQTLRINAPGMLPHEFSIGPMDQPMEFLRGCEDQLVTMWGYDPAFEKDAQRPPTLNNGRSVAQNLYLPSAYIVNHQSWIAHMRLTVTTEGKVADCVVQSPRFSRKSLRQFCRSIDLHAEFLPALDAAGKPVPALYHASVMFVTAD